MAYYFNVVALCVGASFCFVLGRALFEEVEPAPAPARATARADAGQLSRK